MIRRDYILRMIQQVAEALARINSLKAGEQWKQTEEAVDEEFNRLAGAGAHAVAQLSETELLAKLMQGEPTQIVRHKMLLLTTLLKEAGDAATAQGNVQQGHACYLKGLNLLLDVMSCNEEVEYPGFVPKVDLFVEALKGSPLPPRTQAALMQHYELNGEFGKAEDFLFGILEDQRDNADALNFGIAFYERVSRKSDGLLEEGNLPRPELETGLAELRRRKELLTAGNSGSAN